jgi:hypothetical protein
MWTLPLGRRILSRVNLAPSSEKGNLILLTAYPY